MHRRIAMSMSKVYALSTQTIANEIRHSCMFKYFILWMNCNINFRFQKNLVLCQQISIKTCGVGFSSFSYFYILDFIDLRSLKISQYITLIVGDTLKKFWVHFIFVIYICYSHVIPSDTRGTFKMLLPEKHYQQRNVHSLCCVKLFLY